MHIDFDDQHWMVWGSTYYRTKCLLRSTRLDPIRFDSPYSESRSPLFWLLTSVNTQSYGTSH